MKSAFTRTGKRDVWGLLDDGRKSLTRCAGRGGAGRGWAGGGHVIVGVGQPVRSGSRRLGEGLRQGGSVRRRFHVRARRFGGEQSQSPLGVSVADPSPPSHPLPRPAPPTPPPTPQLLPEQLP